MEGDNFSSTDSLNRLHRAILAGLCGATKGGKNAHVPEEAFIKRSELKGIEGKRALQELIALGYVRKHPTRGGMTYELDGRGLEICRQLKEQRKSIKGMA